MITHNVLIVSPWWPSRQARNILSQLWRWRWNRSWGLWGSEFWVLSSILSFCIGCLFSVWDTGLMHWLCLLLWLREWLRIFNECCGEMVHFFKWKCVVLALSSWASSLRHDCILQLGCMHWGSGGCAVVLWVFYNMYWGWRIFSGLLQLRCTASFSAPLGVFSSVSKRVAVACINSVFSHWDSGAEYVVSGLEIDGWCVMCF